MSKEARDDSRDVSLRRRVESVPKPVRGLALAAAPGAVVAAAFLAAPELTGAAHALGSTPGIGVTAGLASVALARTITVDNGESGGKFTGLVGISALASSALGTSIAEAAHGQVAVGAGVGAGAGAAVGFIGALVYGGVAAEKAPAERATLLRRIALGATSVAIGSGLIDGSEHLGGLHPFSSHSLAGVGVGAALTGVVAGGAALRNQRIARRAEAPELGG